MLGGSGHFYLTDRHHHAAALQLSDDKDATGMWILKVEFTWKDEIDTGKFMCEFRPCFTWKFPPLGMEIPWEPFTANTDGMAEQTAL